MLDLQQAIAMLDDLPSLLNQANDDELRGIIQQIFATIWLEPEKITAAKATKNYALLLNQQQSVVGGTTSAGVEYAPATLLPFPLWRAFHEAG